VEQTSGITQTTVWELLSSNSESDDEWQIGQTKVFASNVSHSFYI
jgi:hypothetical protein